MSGKHVIIVGAGIIGASFAYYLSAQGARVTLLDAGAQPGGIATPKSWAWINASWGNPEAYFRLRHFSMGLWRELGSRLPALGVNWCGGLLWDLPRPDLEAYVRQQSSWGYGIRLVDGTEAQSTEPGLNAPPEIAAHVAEEGCVEPVTSVEALLAAARDHGATLCPDVFVQELHIGDNGVDGVVTNEGFLGADEVIVAAGVAAPALLSSLDITFPLDTPSGLLVHSVPVPKMLNGLVMSPELHVRQTAEGRLVAGSDFGGADPADDPHATAAALFEKVCGLIKGGEALEMDFHTIGQRPTPPDGVSAVGRIKDIKGLYLCVTHSGITLAPALGKFGAQDILAGVRDALLVPFSPDRLLS